MAEQKESSKRGEDAPEGLDWGYVQTPEKHKDMECGICHKLAIEPVLLSCDFHQEDDEFESPLLCRGETPPPISVHTPQTANKQQTQT